MNEDCVAQAPNIFQRIKYFLRLHRLQRRFKRREKTNLELHAEEELKRIGAFSEEGDFYGGMTGEAVMELVKVFADQGHSGMSAGLVRSLFTKAADFQPLSPLQGTEDEWKEPYSYDGTRQNKRCSHVFMDANGRAYDIEGKIFREPSGICYTSGGSVVDITFPYIPKKEYVNVPENRD